MLVYVSFLFLKRCVCQSVFFFFFFFGGGCEGDGGVLFFWLLFDFLGLLEGVTNPRWPWMIGLMSCPSLPQTFFLKMVKHLCEML